MLVRVGPSSDEHRLTLKLVDNLGNTAGDIALSLNNIECYNLVRDAGVRTGECKTGHSTANLMRSRTHYSASLGSWGQGYGC